VLYRTLRYDALRDFTPVHGLTQTPLLLVCNAERPWKTLAEFIAFAKAKPAGEVTFASSGIGTGTHMAAELFQLAAGVKLTQVPYTGSAPALNDLVAGRTDIMFDYVVSTRAFLQAGKLRPLAMTGPARFAALPEIPTMKDAGLPEAETVSWSAMMAPAATPAPVVARLAEAMRAGLSEPRVVETLVSTGSTPLMMSGEPFRRFVAEDIARWRQVIERAGVTAG
jgi:tripartite-type tricarboxylate transporter receptor subunit TctC